MIPLKKSPLFLASLLPLGTLAFGAMIQSDVPVVDYCQNAAEIQKLSPELSQLDLTCLDSVSAPGVEKVIFYQEEPEEKLIVVTATSSDSSVDSLSGDLPLDKKSKRESRRSKKQKRKELEAQRKANKQDKSKSVENTDAQELSEASSPLLTVKELNNSALFPDHCGEALMGARVLPHSEKVAILYDNEVFRIVDINTGDITDHFDKRPEDVAYLCYGYTPNADALRQEVSLNFETKSIQFEYSDWNDLETVCEPVSLLPEEIESLQSNIERMKGYFSAVEGRLLKEPDEEMRKHYQKQLKDIQSVIQSDQDTLKTGKKCHEQAKSKSGVLHY